jgi:uncharacterized membrane protein (UPF0182 family)
VGVRDGMTISLPGQSPQQRRTARIAGVWFVITFVASIPALLLYDPVLNDTGYITGAGADNRIFLGATLELILIAGAVCSLVVAYEAIAGREYRVRVRHPALAE